MGIRVSAQINFQQAIMRSPLILSLLSWAILCASANHGQTSIEDEVEKILEADIAETSYAVDDGDTMASRAVSAKGDQGMAVMLDELAKAEKDEEEELKEIFYSFEPLMAKKAHGRDALTATSRGWFKKMRRSVKKRWRRARRSVRKRWRRTRRSIKKRWNRVRRGVKKFGRRIGRGIRKIGRFIGTPFRKIRDFLRKIRKGIRRLRTGMAKVRYFWKMIRSVRSFVRRYPAAPNRMLQTNFNPDDEGLINNKNLLGEE